MKLSEIKNSLDAEVLSGHDQMNMNIVGGGGADLMEDVLSAVAKGSVLLTGLTTEQVLRTATIAGVLAIVIVRGKKPDTKMLEAAVSSGIPILRTRYSLFVACGRLYMEGLRGLDGSW
jgi:predicted transcriptional regulator